ncbi:MAG: hypothetical protein K5931_09815 [Lachnospiraceae bacterium]|nr:hypothetical protein [Lachnospiraceae bacterium]
MISLIRADIKRILRKPSYRLILIICMVLIMIGALDARLGLWNGLTFVSSISFLLTFIDTILGITIFLAVYADEFSSNSMQCLIGRGISRFKLIASKLCNCIIITFMSYGLMALLVTILALSMRADMNSMEASFIYASIFMRALKMLGFATVAMIVLFAFRNIALATFVDVLLVTAADMINNIFDIIPVIKFMHLENYFYSGAINCAEVDFLFGDGKQILFAILLFLILGAVSLLLSYMIFRKKELEF